MAEMTLEILIPVRNPTDVFIRTAESLAAQTDKGFSVLISDNFSKSGREFIDRALTTLSAAGISVRRIQPPSEIGRVEHWNWLHYQSGADWLKPLFAGDWLEPDYVQSVRGISAKEPKCGYIYCNYAYHKGGETSAGPSPWRADRWWTPEEAQDIVMRYAMQFGPPSVAAYRRDLFLRSGGYDPTLPIAADSLFFCKLAARNGAYGLSRVGAHFNIHGARFSDTLPGRQRETKREILRYYAELGATAWHERWRFPMLGYLRLWVRQLLGRNEVR